MKSQATDRMRIAVNDAMDVHGGKGIIEGPLNYLGSLYRGVPIAITVEGANIVTRALIQFGQGAIRCHPYLLKEMQALEDTDRERGLDAFDQVFWGHVGHSLANAVPRHRAAPGPAACSRRRLTLARRHRSTGSSAAMPRPLRLPSILSLLTLGGALKRKEMISARFGDILSELYLPAPRSNAGMTKAASRPICRCSNIAWRSSFATIESALRRTPRQFPGAAGGVAVALFHSAVRPAPAAAHPIMSPIACADLITTPSAARDRLTVDLYHPTELDGSNGIALVERAFTMTAEVQPIRDRMHAARVRDIDQAVEQGTITADEAAKLKAAADAVAAAIAVDDFAPEELTLRGAKGTGTERTAAKGEASSQATSPAPPVAAE